MKTQIGLIFFILSASITLQAKEKTCTITVLDEEKTYSEGSMIIVEDGCNSCSCSQGEFSCTDRPCPSDDLPLPAKKVTKENNTKRQKQQPPVQPVHE